MAGGQENPAIALGEEEVEAMMKSNAIHPLEEDEILIGKDADLENISSFHQSGNIELLTQISSLEMITSEDLGVHVNCHPDITDSSNASWLDTDSGFLNDQDFLADARLLSNSDEPHKNPRPAFRTLQEGNLEPEEIQEICESYRHHDANEAIAHAFQQLSIDEQRSTMNDFLGVPDHENLELYLSKKEVLLKEMDVWIERERSNYPAYNMAELQNSSYTKDPEFRWRFLQKGREFPPHSAALNLMKYFEAKFELFGPTRLVHEIRQSDLDDDDLQCLRNGHMSYLGRDRTGRPIMLHAISHGVFQNFQNMKRCFFYMASKFETDEQAIQRGVVGLVYNISPKQTRSECSREYKAPPPKLMWEMHKLLPRTSVWVSALHHLVNDPFSYGMISVVSRLFINRKTFSRSQIHYGCPSQLNRRLFELGIERVPIDDDGVLDQHAHHMWLEQQASMESNTLAKTTLHPTTNGVLFGRVHPTTNDVLFGRGRGSQYHIGNLQLRESIQSRLSEYDKCTRKGKAKIVDDIIIGVKAKGGRFLKKQAA